jgi:DNA (cytosine-5)-methyltransferase 1
MLKAVTPATDVQPGGAGAKFPRDRTFRFAIPSLRLKSGVRFELVNECEREITRWKVNFYFGTSKSIHNLSLDRAMYRRLLNGLPNLQCKKIGTSLSELSDFVRDADIVHMQRLWSHRGVGRTRPFMLLDKIDDVGASVVRLLKGHKLVSRSLVLKAVDAHYQGEIEDVAGLKKLDRNASLILAGLLVGCTANIELTKKEGIALLRRA